MGLIIPGLIILKDECLFPTLKKNPFLLILVFETRLFNGLCLNFHKENNNLM